MQSILVTGFTFLEYAYIMWDVYHNHSFINLMKVCQYITLGYWLFWIEGELPDWCSFYRIEIGMNDYDGLCVMISMTCIFQAWCYKLFHSFLL